MRTRYYILAFLCALPLCVHADYAHRESLTPEQRRMYSIMRLGDLYTRSNITFLFKFKENKTIRYKLRSVEKNKISQLTLKRCTLQDIHDFHCIDIKK